MFKAKATLVPPQEPYRYNIQFSDSPIGPMDTVPTFRSTLNKENYTKSLEMENDEVTAVPNVPNGFVPFASGSYQTKFTPRIRTIKTHGKNRVTVLFKMHSHLFTCHLGKF